MFIVYKSDGQIIATIIGPGEEYGDTLTRENKQWLFYSGADNLDPTMCYVDVATKTLKQNQMMVLRVDKQKFYANEIDVATISGIPLKSDVVVLCNDQPYGQFVANDDKLEFATDQVAEYKIYVSCLRYMPASITIQSIEVPPTVESGPSGNGHTMSIPDYSDLAGK